MSGQRRLVAISILLLTALLVAGGCGGGAPPQPAPGPEELTVELFSFGFKPSEITLSQGQEVRLTLTSTDIEHTFTVDALGVDFRVGPGETRTVSFTPGKAGTFELYCAIPGHKEAGMVGEVTIR